MRSHRLISIGGMFSAVSIALLFMASTIPTMQWGLCLIASLMLAVPLSNKNTKLAILVYFSVLLLSSLIIPRKMIVLLYMTMGIYTAIKYFTERINKVIFEWIIKFVFVNLMIYIEFNLIKIGFLNVQFDFPQVSNIIVIIIINIAFIFFDVLFSNMIFIVNNIFSRVRRYIRKEEE